MEVSVIGLGTWQLGGEWGKSFTPSEASAIFDEARAQGITLVDTAECYGDHVAERLVGEAIRRDRDRWIVATKFGHRYTGGFERDQLWSTENVRTQLEDSLAALGTDRVDLYQFHSGTSAVFDNDELWSLLARQREAGKVRALGISIASSIGAEQQLYQARRAREVGAECLQLVYNRLQPAVEASIFPLCRAHRLGVLARVPLASGFLSGKYGAGVSFSATDVRSRRTGGDVEKTVAEVERVRREEVPPGTSLAAWALAWCLRDPVVTAVIPGCKDRGQVAQNAAAAALLGR
jgi:aryl-alcohol dehydrogenase-like predicted oxidoreductase